MIQGSPGWYTIEGAKTVVVSGDSRTACSASAFERKKRVRWNPVAPIAEKKTKRDTPALSASRSRRMVASPLTSSIVPPG